MVRYLFTRVRSLRWGVVLLAGLALSLGFLSACSATTTEENTEGEGSFQTISAQEARTMMEENSTFVLLDVRTEEEYAEAHIEGALLIPDYEISLQAASALPDKDELILIYCRSGRRSALAAEELTSMGYTQVYDFGGIIDWPYETISGSTG